MALLPLLIVRAVTILYSVRFEEVNNFLGLVLASIIPHDYEQSMRFVELLNVATPFLVGCEDIILCLQTIKPSVSCAIVGDYNCHLQSMLQKMRICPYRPLPMVCRLAPSFQAYCSNGSYPSCKKHISHEDRISILNPIKNGIVLQIYSFGQ